MNIFYLDKCPKKAAQLQYNKHVVKMILESAQMYVQLITFMAIQKMCLIDKPIDITLQQYGLEKIHCTMTGYTST